VREVYRSDLAAAAKWIEGQPSDQPIRHGGDKSARSRIRFCSIFSCRANMK